MQYGLPLALTALATFFVSTGTMAQSSNDKVVFEHLQDYMEAAPFADGVITAAQLKGLTASR